MVSNELGAGNPHRAKHAMAVSLKLSILLVLMVVSALGFGHDIWAGFFSDSSIIIQEYASMTPLLVISILFDTFQSIFSGLVDGLNMRYLLPGLHSVFAYTALKME
ncbi:hypothetical protein F0562_010342 [Nyssa sinensis]|uniref:Uncharacterized protein n=1 Tax=Nyssa sinensis TaxID=561372 RepID=A0A5J5A0V0_9ASTE|nr:hypothetical protein F0562_010342 [Nyssa sinensis]